MALRLVADVGGTNTRLGLSKGGILSPLSVRSYKNDIFCSFEEVAKAYLQERSSLSISEIVIAIAGPTSGGISRLTNRNWHFDASDLAARFGDVPVSLLNDLRALGYALPLLSSKQVAHIAEGSMQPNDQSLVVGIGTGFNVCPVTTLADTIVCMEAEAGHAHLPASIAANLQQMLGSEVALHYRTIEGVFSGRGYKTLGDAFSKTCQEVADHDSFRSFYLSLLAQLISDLSLTYLPRNGIFFAGGVARMLFQNEGANIFRGRWSQYTPAIIGGSPPIGVIHDDHAALYGCSTYQTNR